PPLALHSFPTRRSSDLIAERDLELRGPGDFFGTRQSGMPTFRVGDLGRDAALMERARREAVDWLANDEDAAELAGRLRQTWKARDRKSTRLNSSHVKIS